MMTIRCQHSLSEDMFASELLELWGMVVSTRYVVISVRQHSLSGDKCASALLSGEEVCNQD